MGFVANSEMRYIVGERPLAIAKTGLYVFFGTMGVYVMPEQRTYECKCGSLARFVDPVCVMAHRVPFSSYFVIRATGFSD